MKPPPLIPDMSDTRVRLIGAGELLLGIAILYYCAYLPLEEARNRIFSAGLYGRLLLGCCVAPALLVLGAVCVLFGLKGFSFFVQRVAGGKTFTLPGRILGVLTAFGAIVFFFWLQYTIEGHGYRF